MLSCLLNNKRINCCDGIYSKEQLKKWANKKILLCPACGKPYEYCHGKVKSPYFRHMDKEECEDKYSEAETEEHIRGKQDLYEWIRNQSGVKDVVLEGWIPETKQKPDIMFTYFGKQYVIEYQCSPISSEYIERHELYQAAGIKDIWILGVEKYLQSNMRKKYIQDDSFGFYSYEDKMLIPISNGSIYCKTKLKKKLYGHNAESFIGRHISNFVFDGEIYDASIGKLFDIEEKQRFRKYLKERQNCGLSNLCKECKHRITSKTINYGCCEHYYNGYCELNLKEKRVKVLPKLKPGCYLDLQENNLAKKLNDNLKYLSNSNWKFYEYWTSSRYKDFCYICAEPILHTKEFEYERQRKVLRDLYSKIKVWKMSDEEYKLCARNIEYLKQILIPIMRENKTKLLKYKFEDIRVLENNGGE